MDYLALSLVAFLASVMSGMSGGAGGMISVPAAIYLGFPPAQVLASMKFGGLGISLGSFIRFRKEEGLLNKKLVLILSIFAGLSALVGSLILVKIQTDTDLIEKAVGWVILAVIPFIVFKNKFKKNNKIKNSKPKSLVGYVLISILVTLQSAMGSGVGFLQYLVLNKFLGMRPLVASATRRTMQLVVAVVALSVYIGTGLVDYKLGLILLVANYLGGYVGSHIAVKKGDDFIEKTVIVISLIMALSLILKS